MNVTVALRVAGVSRNTAYDHREKFPEFDTAWCNALVSGRKMKVDAIELGFLDRLEHGTPAFTGSGEPIIDEATGLQCREWQDSTTLKSLAALRPNVYSEKKKVEVSGSLRTMTQDEVIAAGNRAEQGIIATLRKRAREKHTD